MIAPFLGCTFGGFIYDLLIFTGQSPINTPWMGLKRIVRPDLTKKRRRMKQKAAAEKQGEVVSEKV
jgi:aquaglyceroporin related protein, other eukaryote